MGGNGWLIALGIVALVLVIMLVARQLYIEAHCTTVLGTQACQ